MSSSGLLNLLTKSALLRIETICDRYEEDLQRGAVKPVDQYVHGIDQRLHTRLRGELNAIAASYVSSNETLVPSAGDSIETNVGPDQDLSHDPTPLAQRFEFRERLGTGGSSTVWKARDRDLDRWVAIKIPHRESVTNQKRFLRESRFTAQLQHPNIVRLHEVAQHENQSYLVCEFIDGDSLAEMLRRHAFKPSEAVDVLIQVADGLAYSHDKGIIHRDVKPQNILMDGHGRPHLADFGLACDTSMDGLNLTRTGEVLGTPAFMAPEQARGASNEADARTDVYATGVVLFQMLTGDLPFRGSIESVIHQIIYADAPSPRQWQRDIPRELEILCLKCLEKDPARRIQSASQLRDELARFRAGQPIQSRPLSVWGRGVKWVQRNRRVALLGGLVFALLLSIAIGSTFAAIMLNRAHTREREMRQVTQAAMADASRSRAQALKAKSLAESEAEVSDSTVDFLQTVFQNSDPIAWTFGGQPIASRSDAKRPSLSEMFTTASQRLQTEMASKPRVQSRLMDILGNGCRGIGMFDQAQTLLEDAARIRAQVAQPSRKIRRDIVTNGFYRGWLQHDLGHFDEAESLYRVALDQAVAMEDAQLLSADIRFQLGCLLHATRRNADAKSMFDAALQTRQQHLPAGSRGILAAQAGAILCESSPDEDPDFQRVAKILVGNDWATHLAIQYTKIQHHRLTKDLDEACACYEALLTDLRENLGSTHPITVLALGECAGLLWERGDYRDALPIVLEAIETGRKLAPHHRQLRHALSRLAFEALNAGQIEQAESYYRESLAISDIEGKFDFDAVSGLAWTSRAKGEFEQALEYSSRLLERQDSFVAQQSAWVLYRHARILESMGDDTWQPFDAESLRNARLVRQPLAHPVWLQRVAMVFRHHDDLDSAERLMRQAVALEQSSRPPDHPRTADRLFTLASLLEQRGQTDESVSLLRQAYEIRRTQLPFEDPRIEATRQRLTQLTGNGN